MLRDIKVLELEGLAPSSYCGMMLADYGAEVILINRAQDGEINMGSVDKNIMNRGKKSIILDLKDKKHRKIFLKMAKEADVLIDPFRPGILEKLGIGPE